MRSNRAFKMVSGPPRTGMGPVMEVSFTRKGHKA